MGQDLVAEYLTAVVPRLLAALEALGLVARYLNPTDLAGVLAAVGEPETPLRAAYEGFRTGRNRWPICAPR